MAVVITNCRSMFDVSHDTDHVIQMPLNPPTVKSSHHILLQKRTADPCARLARRHTVECAAREHIKEVPFRETEDLSPRNDRAFSLPLQNQSNRIAVQPSNHSEWNRHRSESIDIKRTDGTLHRLQPFVKDEDKRAVRDDTASRSDLFVRWCKRKSHLRGNSVCY